MVKYIPGLDALRGFAALLVVIGHVGLIKNDLGLTVMKFERWNFFNLGDIAVTFFFVLSGFLITYLLLLESENSNINIGKFYIRRILRIWPLYFLLLTIGLFIYPFASQYVDLLPDNKEITGAKDILLHVFLFPNLADQSNPLCFQSWSIGIEEQFYIVYPILFFLSKKYNTSLSKFLLLFVAAIFLLRFLNTTLTENHIENVPINTLSSFFYEASFDNMAVGALFGASYYYKIGTVLARSRYISIIVWLTTILLVLKDLEISFGISQLIYQVLFGLSIYLISTSSLNNSFLESKIPKLLGKISYGIYMYHVVAIYLIINLLDFRDYNLWNSILVYAMSVIATILLSLLSYQFYEKYFISLKSRFSLLK